MQDDDKIFSLIAQAEDIQSHAVKLQRVALDAIEKLPDASRTAVRDATKEFIVEGAEKASRGLLDASNEAKATSAALRRTGLLLGVFLLMVALIIIGIAYILSDDLVKSRVAKLAELQAQIDKEQTALAELREKTWAWGLELVDYGDRLKAFGDGSRGIILPSGVEIDRTFVNQADSRSVVIIKQSQQPNKGRRRGDSTSKR
jgi:hypothetical protein